jgi:hypothetical protein
MHKFLFIGLTISMLVTLLFLQIGCTQEAENKALSQEEMIALGKYIVHTNGCDDCHTPKIFTENGPIPDTTRLLSGFPEGEALPSLDIEMIGPEKWIATEKHLGAWVGPWGISYASNLTPDNATGIGALSEEMFIKTLREGKWMGVGRPLLPPMPWQVYGTKTDQDLKAMYAYLQTLKPIRNEVPQPVTPDKMSEFLANEKID